MPTAFSNLVEIEVLFEQVHNAESSLVEMDVVFSAHARVVEVPPALRQRQRDDGHANEGGRRQRTGQSPTSRQFSLRQGHWNTYR